MTPEQKRRQDIRKATSEYGSDKRYDNRNGRTRYPAFLNPYTNDRSNTLNKLYDRNNEKYDAYRKTHDYGYSDDPKENADLIRKGHSEGKKSS